MLSGFFMIILILWKVLGLSMIFKGLLLILIINDDWTELEWQVAYKFSVSKYFIEPSCIDLGVL